MRQKIKKAAFNLLWLILSLVVILVVSGVFLTKKYEDFITQTAIEQVNQKLEAKISVEEIDFSLFTKFPHVSVVFKNVVVWSSNNFNRAEFPEINCDTILNAEKIYLQFNIAHLLLGKYNIKRILIADGSANLLIDKSGNTNYKIFKEKRNTDNVDDKSRTGQLEAFRLSDFNVRFLNKAKNLESKVEIKDVLLKGKFTEEEFSMASNSRFILNSFSREGISYADNYELTVKIILDIQDRMANIKKGVLTINNVNLSTTGTIDYSGTPDFNLQIEGRNLDINSALDLLPAYVEETTKMSAKGTADIAVRVKGPISSTQSPEIKSVYLLNIYNISYKSLYMRNLKLKGKFSTGVDKNPGSSTISIEKFKISDNNNELEGSFYLSNFHSPKISLSVSGYTDLLFINDFWTGNPLNDLTGTVYPNMKIETTLSSLKEFKLQNILEGELTGEFGFSNTGFQYGESYRLQNINGLIKVNKDNWLGNIDLDFNESKTSLMLRTDYLLNYLFGYRESLWLSADIKSDHLNIEDFIKNHPEKANGIQRKGLFLPENIFAKINADVAELNFRKFSLEKTTANLEIKPGQLDIYSYSMSGMGGDFSGSAAIQQDLNGNFTLASKSILKNVEINKLFESFNNFNQNAISHTNLSGKLSGEADFSITADSLLQTNKEAIILNSKFVLKSGELIDFEPVKKLSGFIEVEELEHIQFSTISNSIFIKDELITIPEMDIKSSAADISVSGTHSFSNYFDYKMRINLSNILAGKASRSKIENEENFVVEDDGRRASLYLSVKGTPEDYMIKYDKKEAVSNIRKDLKEEKNTIKNILNEEFGWFKNDSLVNTDFQEQESREFIMDWGEEDKEEERSFFKGMRKGKKDKKEEETFKFEWDEGDGR